MAALRAPVVVQSATFRADVEALRPKFTAINEAVADLVEVLTESWFVPHVAIAPKEHPDVCGVALDYRLSGAAGKGLFFVTYHAGPEAANKMRDPLRTYTLLTITER
jgi:hypothetical protein